MSRPATVLERWGADSLLLLCGLACILVVQSTRELERANHRCRAQLQLLSRLLAAPSTAAPGPIAQLDGLYTRRLARVTTPYGPAIVFADDQGETAPR